MAATPDPSSLDAASAEQPTRFALFGDVQGHLSIYTEALTELGVDVDRGRVPPELVVIQVGDLIHKGPDSDGVVALADRLLRVSPDNYVQLIGNHEGQYLGGPMFWQTTIGDDAARTLARWFVEGACRLAVGLDTAEHGLVLVSHAGLSAPGWQAMGAPHDPVAAARILNEEFWNNPAVALRPGIMLRGETGPPGVAWTEPVRELYQPWSSTTDVPFAQVHGHASPYSWVGHRWYQNVPRKVRRKMTVDEAARHTSLDIGGKAFLGIDTAFGSETNVGIVPLVLHAKPSASASPSSAADK